MKPELLHLQTQIQALEDFIHKTEVDLKHVGMVAVRRITFIGGGLMLQIASNSVDVVALTPLSMKGLFNNQGAPRIDEECPSVFTLKRKLSPTVEVKGRRMIESSNSQVTLVDVVEDLDKCNLDEEDCFSNTSYCTAREDCHDPALHTIKEPLGVPKSPCKVEVSLSLTPTADSNEQYVMTDVSDDDEYSDEDTKKPIPDWAQHAEALWLKARTKWTAEAIFKYPDIDLTAHLGRLFSRDLPKRNRRSSGTWQ
jgi:hypothetical protein